MVKPIEIRPTQNLMCFVGLICNLKQLDRQPNSQVDFLAGQLPHAYANKQQFGLCRQPVCAD